MLIILIISTSNLIIVKLISKIVNDKTTFLNNLTLIIFNFRININYYQIIQNFAY